MIETIKERKLPSGIEIINEVVKPVAEKWNDGLVRETDNLQVTFRSVADQNLKEVMAYLHYYDAEGNELGHEFDLPEANVLPGAEARVSLMLAPPENFSYTILEFKAEQENKPNHLSHVVVVAIGLLALFLVDRYW